MRPQHGLYTKLSYREANLWPVFEGEANEERLENYGFHHQRTVGRR